MVWDGAGLCGPVWDGVGRCGTLWDAVGRCGVGLCDYNTTLDETKKH